MATELIGTIVTLAGLVGVVWKASKLQSSIEKSIEEASKRSDRAIETSSEETKEGQQRLQLRFEQQFKKLQDHNVSQYRELNQNLQLHLRDFDHDRTLRVQMDDLLTRNIQQLGSETNQRLTALEKQLADVVGYLRSRHDFDKPR
jgi:hypothetical protein